MGHRQGALEGLGVNGFWQGRRVFVTGQTGFKGAWLCLWLERLGAKVSAFALDPPTHPSLYALAGGWSGQEHTIGDLRDLDAVKRAVARANPQIILHMAAQALVRPSYRDPIGTFASNVMGTAHLLEATRSLSSLEAVVVVTSDKVYENEEQGRPFSEGDRLGGKDPYSSSKACAELVTRCYRDSFFADGVPIATARAGNVIGGGDWAEARLVPDLVRALDDGQPVALRYPEAVRPWQHVLEPLLGYLALAEALSERPEATPPAVNFGPRDDAFLTVSQVVDAFGEHFGGRPGWRFDGGDHPREAGLLTLDAGLAASAFGWRPRLSVAQAIDWTASWYRAWRDGGDARSLSLAQIERFEEMAR